VPLWLVSWPLIVAARSTAPLIVASTRSSRSSRSFSCCAFQSADQWFGGKCSFQELLGLHHDHRQLVLVRRGLHECSEESECRGQCRGLFVAAAFELVDLVERTGQAGGGRIEIMGKALVLARPFRCRGLGGGTHQKPFKIDRKIMARR
jgi:hypothetical protein